VPVAIRPARPDDAAAICAIHNEGILDRVATLDTAERTVEGTSAWLAERDSRHPVIVADLDGTVVGWASLNRFNPRAAYDAVADFSVYVARDRRGQRIGGQLLGAVVALARTIGFHKMVLAALAHNDAGIAMYQRGGFRHVGVYRQHGFLEGRWVDVVIMEKLL
jgi:L-amino acid N-acyltransferase YncA